MKQNVHRYNPNAYNRLTKINSEFLRPSERLSGVFGRSHKTTIEIKLARIDFRNDMGKA